MLRGIVGDRFAVIVIDTAPIEDQAGIVSSALRAVTEMPVPVVPTPPEIDRLLAVGVVADAVDDSRRDSTCPQLLILLSRAVASAASTGVWRVHLVGAGLRVLRPIVARLERFAQSYSRAATTAAQSAYGDVAQCLLGRSTVTMVAA
jgi:chromosome partitioning protein